jgi:hypothetical protein
VESNQISATVERARQYFGEVRERDLPALPASIRERVTAELLRHGEADLRHIDKIRPRPLRCVDRRLPRGVVAAPLAQQQLRDELSQLKILNGCHGASLAATVARPVLAAIMHTPVR